MDLEKEEGGDVRVSRLLLEQGWLAQVLCFRSGSATLHANELRIPN
jgi:hypothetical protein